MRAWLLKLLERLFYLLGGEVPAASPPQGSAFASPSAPLRRARASADDEDMTGVKILDVVAFNAEVEPQAVALWTSMLQERGTLRVSVLCVEAAYRFDVSTETAKRWLLKHSAEAAEFSVERGLVRLRV